MLLSPQEAKGAVHDNGRRVRAGIKYNGSFHEFVLVVRGLRLFVANTEAVLSRLPRQTLEGALSHALYVTDVFTVPRFPRRQ